MPSAINYNSIDELFPVPGQDNESQGFRENFAVIKDSLQAAKTEIEALQNNTAKINVSNNFNGNEVENAKLSNVFYQSYILNNPIEDSAVDINFQEGYHQVYKVAVNTTITIVDWIDVSQYASFKLALYGSGTVKTVNFAVKNLQTSTFGTIYYDREFPLTFQVQSETKAKVLEFWSYDGGTNVFVKYLGEYDTTKVGNSGIIDLGEFQDLVVKGNTTLGDSNADRVIISGIPILPNLNSSQRAAIVNPLQGMLIFNTTDKKVQVYILEATGPGTPNAWVNL